MKPETKLDPTEEINKVVGKFPFAMAVTSIFFSGNVFVLFNAPLIVLLLSNKTFLSFIDLLNNGVFIFWKSLTQTSNNIFSIAVFLLLSFIAGVIITPFERLLVTITILSISIILRKIKRFKRMCFFTPREMLTDDYEDILGWLLSNPSEKSHWEWELFNYYIYWSVATSSFVAALISVFLLRGSISILELVILFTLIGTFFGFAVLHSLVMGKVHNRYRRQHSYVSGLVTRRKDR
jgi:hypothetical protein